MNAIWIFLVSSIGYLVAYHTYGRFLAQKIFKIDPNAQVPSKELADGNEFVSSERQVMFGHHFTSIAGTGPIVGPAIGIIWGWGPALVWVFLGAILMGAVHDFGVLMLSVRHQGASIAQVAGEWATPRVRSLFFMVIFLALLIVMAIFGLVIAIIFKQFPQSVWAVWGEIPIAILFGTWILKQKRVSLGVGTLLGVGALYVLVALGAMVPFEMPSIAGIPATGVWTIILLAYAYIASVLPVGTLLQPRDFLNAWQLYVALGAIIIGMIVTAFGPGLPMVAPVLALSPAGAPPLWPFLFITVACGAISGFHSLVCSGTSSKQIASEADVQYIGYGSMVTEGLLAVVVLIAVGAGIGLSYTSADGQILQGTAAWYAHYGSWSASAGLGSKLTAVVIGFANMMASIGISEKMGVAIVGVFIASFAGTTLDSATRVQRYMISEYFATTGIKWGQNKWVATGIAVITALLLAFSSGPNGAGALLLWPMFGAINQLLAALALLVLTLYLQSKGGRAYWVTGLPCLLLTVLTVWACTLNQVTFWQSQSVLLILINGIILALSLLMILEMASIFRKRAKLAHEQVRQ